FAKPAPQSQREYAGEQNEKHGDRSSFLQKFHKSRRALTPNAFGLVRLPVRFLIELASRARCDANEDPGVRWKRQWNLSQLIHPRSGGNGNRRELSDLDCPFPDDVAA